MTAPTTHDDGCANCRRPLHWLPGVGWVHGELRQYAHEDASCARPKPNCQYSRCDHSAGPIPGCACRCHNPKET